MANHPGYYVNNVLLNHNITQKALAKAIKKKPAEISAIVNGRKAINADMAMRLGHAFGILPEVWMEAQSDFDIAKLRERHLVKYNRIKKILPPTPEKHVE